MGDFKMDRTGVGDRLSPREEAIGILLAVWAVVGLFLDGWAHSEQKPDSFFTPWHAVLYSGFSAAAGWSLFTIYRRSAPGVSWREAAPKGQLVTFAGFAIFGVGAAGDLLWHETFGIELGVEALLSPTHLLLMTGGLTALSAPLRTAWAFQRVAPSFGSFLPALMSLTLVTAVVRFFFLYLSPFEVGEAVSFPATTTDIHDVSRLTAPLGAQLRERWALASFLVTSIILILPVLLVLKRWRPPAGAFTLLFTIAILLETAVGEFKQPLILLSGILAGAAADLLARKRVPAPVTGFAVPVILWVGYFAIVGTAYDLGWSPDLWLGITLMSGLLCGAMGFLATPSRPPSSSDDVSA